MTRLFLASLLLTSWVICPALRADEAVAVKAGTITSATDLVDWSAYRTESWLRLAQQRISTVLCDLGAPGEWADHVLDRYLTALEAGPEGQVVLPTPPGPEWCDGRSTGPPPAHLDRYMVEVSFTF